MPSLARTLTAIVPYAVTVAAHGYVTNIVVNGVSYQGYDVTKFPYQADPPVVIGWSTDAKDTGFVAPDAFDGPDIICHRNASNAAGHAQVAAGDQVFLQWTAWPDSHHGPVIDYLASCGDAGCESVDKTTLKFFKIDEVGLVDGSQAPGQYGDDLLIANSNGWMVQIPSNVKPGFYVLRHELIALHSAGQEDGAQNYPQCINLEITGSGTEEPSGVLGTELYSPTDDGIVFNIYTTLSSYPVPGPTVIEGASAVSQSTSAIKTSGVPTTGSELSGGSPTGSPAGSSTGSPAGSPTGSPTESPARTPTSATPVGTASGVQTGSATVPANTDPEQTSSPGCSAKKRKTKKRNKRSKKARRHHHA